MGQGLQKEVIKYPRQSNKMHTHMHLIINRKHKHKHKEVKR